MSKTSLRWAALVAGLVLAAGSGQVSAQVADDAPDADEAASTPSSGLFEIKPENVTLQRRLRFQVLGRESGLPSLQVDALVQDKTGFMWLGTQDGLARYDGQHFVVFRNDPKDDTTLSSSFIHALLLAHDGTLWVGTQGGGVNRYKPKDSTFDRFTASDAADTLNEGTVMAMSEGPDGRIWIGTNGGGLGALDPKTGKVFSYSADSGLNPVVTAVLVTKKGAIWVGTTSGVFRFDAKEGLAERMFRDKQALGAKITVLTEDSSGNIWIGTDNSGLARYSPKSEKLEMFEPDAKDFSRLADGVINSVFEDKSHRIWVATEGALHILDPETGKLERHTLDPDDPKSLPGQPHQVYQDAAGAIWVATLAGGAAIVDPLSLRFNYYPSPFTSSVFRKGQDLWVATAYGVYRWRGDTSFEGLHWPTGQSYSVLVDHQGTVWVGTGTEGLFRLDPGSVDRWTVYAPNDSDPNSIGSGWIVKLYEDRAGNVWAGMMGGGLQRFDRERGNFVTAEALPSSQVYDIEEDPKEDGVLWIGTADRGLVRLDTKRGKAKAFLPDPDNPNNLTDNSATDFLFDGDQTIWLATFGGGLKRFDRKKKSFKSYTREQGMPSDTLYSILRDKTGKLWLSSNGGLARFDPKTETTQVFSTADGLQSEEFTLGCARDVAGYFFFGGDKGFNLFKPEDIDIDRYKPPVVLTAINVLGEPYQGGRRPSSVSEMDLDYDETFVDIEFAALSYSGANRLKFEYKVEGLSDRWFSIKSPSVVLPGLKDGSYSLLLRAKNRHGVESDPTRIRITVAPPPWRTWWAYTGYGLVVLGMLFGIYRYQQVRIIRLEKLARLATVEREFEVTADVQSWFLPDQALYTSWSCNLVGFYRAADKCSGDWWWYEDVGDGKLWVIVADVTGHGAGPAMVTAAVAMGLRVQRDFPSAEPNNLIKRLERVNREVLVRAKGKAHMTMTALVLDQQTGMVTVYGVGGLPAVLMKSHGKHSVVNPRGTPLGSAEELEVGEKTVQMEPGDRLMILTDGIVETPLPNGKSLGFRRFSKLMREVKDMPLDQAAARLAADVDQARGGETQEDDFTFCIVERRG